METPINYQKNLKTFNWQILYKKLANLVTNVLQQLIVITKTTVPQLFRPSKIIEIDAETRKLQRFEFWANCDKSK